MALSKLQIYRKAMGIVSDLKSEIKQDQILGNALKDIKKAYAQKTSAKQRTLFVKKKYKQHGNVDLPLVAFYKRAIKGLGKNTGDGTLWNDSAIVIETVTFLQKHFETKVISAHHFTRLGEEMKLALTGTYQPGAVCFSRKQNGGCCANGRNRGVNQFS